MQRRVLATLVTVCAVAVFTLLVLGSGASASPSKARTSKDAYVDFRMPSNNIFCAYVATAGYPSYLRCDIESGLKPAPPKKVGKECSYGITVDMNQRGSSHYGCVSDAVYNTSAPKLNYGSTWRHGGFTCKASMAGLKCTNLSGHGFFLSKQHSYLF